MSTGQPLTHVGTAHSSTSVAVGEDSSTPSRPAVDLSVQPTSAGQPSMYVVTGHSSTSVTEAVGEKSAVSETTIRPAVDLSVPTICDDLRAADHRASASQPASDFAPTIEDVVLFFGALSVHVDDSVCDVATLPRFTTLERPRRSTLIPSTSHLQQKES